MTRKRVYVPVGFGRRAREARAKLYAVQEARRAAEIASLRRAARSRTKSDTIRLRRLEAAEQARLREIARRLTPAGPPEASPRVLIGQHYTRERIRTEPRRDRLPPAWARKAHRSHVLTVPEMVDAVAGHDAALRRLMARQKYNHDIYKTKGIEKHYDNSDAWIDGDPDVEDWLHLYPELFYYH